MLHNSTLLSQAKRLAFLLVPALFLTGAVFAQPGTAFVSITNVSGTPVNFSDASSWAGAAVPGDTSNVTISNCYMLMDVDMVFGSLTIAPGGYLDFGSRTITVMDQLLCSQLNGVFNSGGTSTVILKSTVADGGSGTVTVGGGNNVTLYNVQVFDGSVVDFDAGGDGTTETTITNELTMGGGSVVVNPPIYGAASTLIYNATYGSVGKEWTAGASSGKGVPHHVSVGSGGTLSFADTTGNFTCTGDFTMDDASGSLDLSSMLGNLTVDGDFKTGTNSAVTLTMPSTEGKGILTVGEDMTINANTTWTGGEGNVKVAGNLTNDASGVAFGLLELNGSGSQTVSSSNSSALTVDSLVVNNSLDDLNLADGDVTFAVNIDITPGGVFNPLDGSVQLNGSGSTFTMNSDASGTARIATLANDATTSDVNGNIVFERYVPAVTDGASWLSIGNYVVGATYTDWSTSFGSSPLLFTWDETHVLVNNQQSNSNGTNAWSIVNSGTLEDADFGYLMYTAANASATFSASGGYNTADPGQLLTFSNTASHGGGWHLLTNPYPCPISGSEFLSDNSGLFSTYYMYNNATDLFETSLTGAPATIDIGQSFWVQASSAGNVSFALDQLTSGSNSFVRDLDEFGEGHFALRVEQEDGLYGSTLVRFHEESTMDWDWEWDATFKQSGNNNNPEIYSVLDNGHQLVVNSVGTASETESIAITIEAGSAGTVSLSMEEGYQLPEGICGLIEDLETGDVAAIGGGPLVVELEPFQVYENRFVLTFMTAPVFEATASYCEGGILHFNGENAELWDVNWEMIGGELSGSGCATGLEAGNYDVDATDPFSQCEVHSNITVPEVCMGDFNLNGERDITDLLILLVGIQPVDNFEGTFPETDCDCDGVMTTLDLLMFLPQFGAWCE